MPASCDDSSVSAMATFRAESESNDQHTLPNFLYQAATVLAVLLFLFSF